MLLKLKAKIIEKYRTQARFAVACGWTEQRLTRIITWRQKPTEEEKTLLVAKLRIPPEEIDEYFRQTR